MYIRTSDGLGQANVSQRDSLIPDIPVPDIPIPDFVKELMKRTGLTKPDILKKAVAPAAHKIVAEAVRRAKAGIPPEKACWIQTVLNKASGEDLVPDGLYGPKTGAAVRRFQARSGLFANGVVDPRTNTALIQTALNQIALASLLPVDGVMDGRTRQEVIRFQTAKNLLPDGIVGPRTRAAMVLGLGGQCRTPTPKPKPPIIISNGNGPKCDQPRFEAEKQACRAQTLRALVECGLTFGLTEATAIGFAGAAIAAAPSVAGLVALAVAAGVTDTIAKVRLAQCAFPLLQQFKDCVQAAKVKTHCL
jgi:hypothetical protein